MPKTVREVPWEKPYLSLNFRDSATGVLYPFYWRREIMVIFGIIPHKLSVAHCGRMNNTYPFPA